MNEQQQAAWAAVKAAMQATAPREVNSTDMRWFAAERMTEETFDYSTSERLNAFFYGWHPSAETEETTADFFWETLQMEREMLEDDPNAFAQDEGLLGEAADFGSKLK